MELCMRDVGDGLNLFIDHGMMVDFGGEQEKIRDLFYHRCYRYCYLFHNINTFVLSHFHKDHYDGLFLVDNHPHYYNLHSLEYVYYQGMPIIQDKNVKNIQLKFLSYLMAMNHYMLGDKSGVASVDLISRLQQLSHKTLKFAPLFKGDVFKYNNREYEVLWPPRKINSDGKIISKIKTAINDFEKAKKDNPDLEKYARKYNDIAKNYAPDNESVEHEKYKYPNESMYQKEFEGNVASKDELRDGNTKKLDKKVLSEPVVKKANKSLRDAANHLSLAFKSSNNELLFFGDLETNQINILCNELNMQEFEVFVTPHHGTHSGLKMKKIDSKIALSSVGKLYSGYLKNKYLKDVSNHLYTTKKSGCLHIGISASSIEVDMCKYHFERISF